MIVSSSDLGDLLAMCTRIVVLRDGRVGAELGGDGLTEHALVNAIEGERSADGANNGNRMTFAQSAARGLAGPVGPSRES